MTITVRGRSLLAALVAIAPLLSGADDVYSSKAATQPETVFHIGRPEQLPVIIELRAAPLVEARRSQDVRLASESLDALTSRLANDLARIEGEAPGRVAAQAKDTGAIRHTYKMVFAGASATVSRASLAAIRALPYVKAVHEDSEMKVSLAKSVPHIGAPQVWQQYGARGKGIIVAVIDTGIDYRHRTLGEGFGPGFKVAGGYDVVNGDADPMDDHGHGTHVAGIVAANHKELMGVAPEATLLAYKVFGPGGGGSASTVLAGVERAIDPNQDGDPSDRADVVNMSLSGPLQTNDPVIAAVERGVAAGAVFSLAAGNLGAIGALGTPALAPSAITVGATDLEDEVATFSSGGPAGGGYAWAMKPEISAPGVNIRSAGIDNIQKLSSGTSMAAPHIAGVAALLLEKHPDWTPLDVKTAIVTTARPVAGRDHVPGPFVPFAGAGRVDAPGAIGATVFPSPYAVTFGLIRTKNQPAVAKQKVTLTNRGTTSETLTLQEPVVPGGATIAVVPQSVTLAPGASAELELELTIPAAMAPTDSGILISGFLTFAGAKTSVRLPWTIVKADVVQVTVGGNDDFDLYISNGVHAAPMWLEGPRTYAAYVPEYLGTDILVITQPADGSDPRLIVREAAEVDGYVEIAVSPDEAVHTVRIEGVDERGVAFPKITSDATGLLWHNLRLPSLGVVNLYYGEARRQLRLSPFERMRVLTYEMVDSEGHRYFAAYRQLRKLAQDETLSIQPSDWTSQKIRTTCPSECELSVGVGTGNPLAFRYHPLPAGTSELTLHLTPGGDPALDFRAYVLQREKNYRYDTDGNPWTYLANAMRSIDGRFSTAPFGVFSKADYSSPDRAEPLVLGEGPAVLRIAAGTFMTEVRPWGVWGESFGGRIMRELDVKVERTDGGPLAPFRYYGPGLWGFRVKPGVHRLTASSVYPIAGREGRVSQVSLYDTTARNDGPPTLTVVRVENGRGVAATTVAARSLSRVVFAARQSTLGQTDWEVQHARVNAAETKAWWRPHGAADWLPLEVVNTGEDYSYKSMFPGSPGTLFSASLAPAVTAEGGVDLKFSVTNLFGGATETTYEPAFFVGPPGTRRRPMR
ncbi:MAG TPA: S8 family serine peptidase [Thermoanaerobaculia bacterium]